MAAIARYYDASKNPEGAVLDGVPLGDVTEDEFAALPAWLQASVDAAPFYRKTKPRAEPDAPAAETDAATPGRRPRAETAKE